MDDSRVSSRHRPPSAYYGFDEVEAETPNHVKRRLKMNNLRLCSSGMFSNVYRGKIVDRENGDPKSIAVKKTFIKSDGRITTMMESKILKVLSKYRHKNIMQLLYTYVHEHEDVYCIALIFEFMPSTLHNYIREWPKIIENKVDYIEIKLLSWQLFRGLNHLRDNHIIHRDLKPQNILVNPENGLLKIGDFGSSKLYKPGDINHPYHVTRYYRAPELLLGAKYYSCEIDLWSAGCILAEMHKGRVFLPGSSTSNQLHQIIAILGRPTDADLESMNALDAKDLNEPKAKKYADLAPKNVIDGLKKSCPKGTPEALQLMSEVLVYNPKNRLGGRKVLKHKYFSQLFEDGIKRYNGKAITILTKFDYESALKDEIEDHSLTGEESTDEQ